MELAGNARWLMAPVRFASSQASTNKELDGTHGER